LPAGLRGLSTKAVSAVKIFIFQPLLGRFYNNFLRFRMYLLFPRSYFPFCLGRSSASTPAARCKGSVIFISRGAAGFSFCPKLTRRFKGTRLATGCQFFWLFNSPFVI
jgi:hypothetical protein